METQYTFLGRGHKYWNTKHSNSGFLCKVGRRRVISFEIYPARKNYQDSLSLEKMSFFNIEAVINCLLFFFFFLWKILWNKKTGMHFWANPHTQCHAMLTELWCYVEMLAFLKYINSFNYINLDLKSSCVFYFHSGHQW